MSKFWLKSKTILFNLSSGFIVILLEYVTPFQSFFGARGYQVAIAVVLMVNLALRSVTYQPLTVKFKPKDP